ncbi:transcriptional regulator FeaR [Luteithermobacter gelatinilyticus]|uniref:transcriptional regulator FeaR n=1 Tax=Luteithermobacter gelatinilyticus TaxID=2582913 RepID=UPI00143E0853|nr:transcriptional regulator FeaR [Luteithermobacter gelatinilyticus]
MSRLYQIGDLPAEEKAELWNRSIVEVCGNFQTIMKDWSNFRGGIEVRNAGGFDVAHIALNAEIVRRSQKQIAESNDKFCFLIMQMEGRALMRQNGNEAFMEPGDMVLIDSGMPSEFRYDGFMRQLSLHIPRETLEACLPECHIPEAQTIPGRRGIGAVTSRFLHSIYDEAETITDSYFGSVREVLLNLLSSTLRNEDADVAEAQKIPFKGIQLRQIQKHIEQYLTDPELSPAMIAGLCGISTRHLHRLFQTNGTSFGEWVRRRRLEEARRYLLDSRFDHYSIIRVAFHWGFNDAAHFSRAFKKEFGLSPREYRLSMRERKDLN